MYLKFHESQQKQRAVYKLRHLCYFYFLFIMVLHITFFLKLKIVKHDYLVFFFKDCLPPGNQMDLTYGEIGMVSRDLQKRSSLDAVIIGTN